METSNDTHTLHVSIVSPERKLFEGETERIAVPGEMGRFEVRHNHAPIISTLTAGTVTCVGSETVSIAIAGGFVEVARNVVSVCVEEAATDEA